MISLIGATQHFGTRHCPGCRNTLDVKQKIVLNIIVSQMPCIYKYGKNLTSGSMMCFLVVGFSRTESGRYSPSKLKLKVWSTVKLRGTRVPQKAIVPVGRPRPRPYSIITLNMRFIPKASLRASSQITANSYILSDIYELIIQSPLPLPLLGRWFANKLLDPKSLY